MKKSPFNASHQKKTIDKDFLNRFKWSEEYYRNICLKSEDHRFIQNLKAIKAINQILQQEMLSLDEVDQAIQIYNETNIKPHHGGSGWYDIRLNLMLLAAVFGK